MPLDIVPSTTDADAHACATLMSSSEPWITLGRGFEESLVIMKRTDREIYVARDGDEFRGFVILDMRGTFSGYIATVAVVPEARGTGLGTQLIRFAEERIFRESPNVFMCVSSFNPRALALYQRLGYEIIGELKDFIVAGHSEILLRKTIGPWTQRR